MKDEPGKSKALRRILALAALAGIAYLFAKRQKPGPCVPSGSPEERVLVKDEESLGGLGTLMQMMLLQLLQEPTKVEILNDMNLVLSIEPNEEPDGAMTMTFSDGYVVLEPGAVAHADVKIACETEDLMKMAGISSVGAAVRFFATPEGKEFAGRALSGQLKISGIVSHPISLVKFSRLLAPGSS